jgi:type IV secretory pathway ATPase VirB11/archaellum biosynthesis ATPase
MPVIRIDDDVAKAIERIARESGRPDTTPNNVIRLALGLPQAGHRKIPLLKEQVANHLEAQL